MRSVQNAHVLFIPSWYGTRENPVHGSFFRDQAVAVEKLGVRTGRHGRYNLSVCPVVDI